MSETNIRYLADAHRTIRKLHHDEFSTVIEYKDALGMLELAKSTKVARAIRRIITEKERHIQITKECADLLRQAINQIEREQRESKERKLFYEITKGPLIPPGGIRKRVHLWKDFQMTKAEFWNQLPKKPPAGFTLEDLEEMWKMDVPDPAEYARRKGAR